MTNKQKVAQLLQSLETGDVRPLRYLSPDRYRQHNLRTADGLTGFQAIQAQLAALPVSVSIVRLFEDGPFVFAHVEYHFPTPTIGFDVFRFEEGMIVEHWDNLQEMTAPAPGGLTMIDGPNLVQDREKTEANKQLATTIVDSVLVHGRLENLASYYEGNEYIQHNPQLPGLVSDLRDALVKRTSQQNSKKYETIHRVLGEGDFVLLVSEGRQDGQPCALYDLFRFENAKIAEHWDTIEAIPPAANWKNANGKF